MITNLAVVSPLQESIIDRLRVAQIPFSNWGVTPETKPIDKFVGYCRTGEYELEDHDGILRVRVNVSVAFVRCIIDRHWWELYEEGQYLDGKRIADRKHRFPGSVAEKIKIHYNEKGRGGAERGLEEELGQTEPRFKDSGAYKLKFEYKESLCMDNADWFPSIPAIYMRQCYICTIPIEMYHETYTEICDDGRTIVFKWRRLVI